MNAHYLKIPHDLRSEYMQVLLGLQIKNPTCSLETLTPYAKRITYYNFSLDWYTFKALRFSEWGINQ